MKSTRGAILVVAFSLGGCAATVTKGVLPGGQAVHVAPAAKSSLVLNVAGDPVCTASADWEGFRGMWVDAFRSEASSHSIHFASQDGPPVATGEDGTLVSVQVHDYRWVSTGARFGLGVITGNAYVDATVRFVDLRSGESFGQQSVNTSSTAWQGIFSAMTSKQLAAIAREAVADVNGP